MSIIKKENEILKRKHMNKKILLKQADRVFFVILNSLANIRDHITIVKPETLLKWQKMFIKGLWTFKYGHRKGRYAVSKQVKELIVSIKNDNLNWGVKRIQGELSKLDIHLDVKTIWKVLQDSRRKGKIKKSLTWKTFLKMQLNSIYAMDCFTVDTILNQRFYVFFIIAHKTREIIQFAVIQNPVREFIRQKIIQFEKTVEQIVYMIHDRSEEFMLNFSDYGIKGIKTSTQAPNMNAIAERFIGSVRREALDYFIILNQKQLENILTKYIQYYNSQRPHQGIEQNVPKGYKPQKNGQILKMQVLSGLHHHYYRKAA